jgi:hypothetical protein
MNIDLMNIDKSRIHMNSHHKISDWSNQSVPAQCRLRPEGLSEGLATGAVLVHGEFAVATGDRKRVTEETDAEPDFARGRSCGEAQDKKKSGFKLEI